MCCRPGLDQRLPRMTDLKSVKMGYTPKPRFRGFGGVRAPARLPVRTVPGIRGGGIPSSTEVTKNGAAFGSPTCPLATEHPMRATRIPIYIATLACAAPAQNASPPATGTPPTAERRLTNRMGTIWQAPVGHRQPTLLDL